MLGKDASDMIAQMEVDQSKTEEVQLFPIEQSLSFMTLTSVTAAYHFSSSISPSHLMERVYALLENNPFLCGRLVRSPTGSISLRYPEKFCRSSDELSPFKCIVCENPFDKSDYNSMMNSVSSRFIKIGQKCVDKDEPLFLVTLYLYQTDSNSKSNSISSSVLISMSHILGDGFTFFRLIELLSISSFNASSSFSQEKPTQNTVASRMDPNRDTGFREAVVRIFGEGVINFRLHWATLTGRIINFMINPKRAHAIFELSMSFLEKQKQLACEQIRREIGSDAGYVTTNDVLLSTLTSCQVFDSDYANLAVHLRPYLHDPDPSSIPRAGNYFASVVLTRAILQSAVSIRKVLHKKLSGKKRSCETTGSSNGSESGAGDMVVEDAFPTVYERLRMYGTLLLTNWCSLSEHFPAFADGSSDQMATAVRMIPLMFHEPTPSHAAVVFNLGDSLTEVDGQAFRRKRLGLAVSTHPEFITRLAQHPLIEKQL